MAEMNVRLDQLDTLDQALQRGQALLQEADSLQVQAQADEAEQRWKNAADKYRRAQLVYQDAARALETPALIGDSSYRALQELRKTAQAAHAQAQAGVEALAQARRAEACEEKIRLAADLLQQAQTAFGRDDFASARSLASQAKDGDPTLLDAAERIVRLANDAEGEKRSPLQLALLILLTLLLIATAVGLGPRLWTTLRDFLFPAAFALGSLV